MGPALAGIHLDRSLQSGTVSGLTLQGQQDDGHRAEQKQPVSAGRTADVHFHHAHAEFVVLDVAETGLDAQR